MRSKWLGMMMVLLGLAMMAVVTANTAFADMIGAYVEAEGGAGGNSVNAADGDDGNWYSYTNSSTDNYWCLRTGQSGYGDNDVFEADGTSNENVPTIKTTITGLTPGLTYELRVIYASENVSTTDWDIGAGLAADSLTTYHWGDGVSEETGLVLEDRGNNDLVLQMQILLGTAVASSAGEISAFVDKITSGGRARYDGLTYLEVPEPATIGLLAVGGALAVFRRKR
jgi:hypothetical protein